MNWAWYLFGFEGRINRAKYWLAALIMLCWMIFLLLLSALPINYLFGAPAKFSFNIDNLFIIFDPQALRSLQKPEIAMIVANFLFMPLVLWMWLATSVKRLHDRDKSGWWLVPFFAIPNLFHQFSERLPDSYLVLPLALMVLGLCLWGFVELYFLSGSRKTNRFGPNPLLSTAPGRRWDQHSEIEMVPHKAGPPPV